MLAESLAAAQAAPDTAFADVNQTGIFGDPIADKFAQEIQDMMEKKNAYESENYSSFAGVMQVQGYAWEAHKVTTDDGYILTTFHVTGSSQGLFTPTMPPVLI